MKRDQRASQDIRSDAARYKGSVQEQLATRELQAPDRPRVSFGPRTDRKRRVDASVCHSLRRCHLPVFEVALDYLKASGYPFDGSGDYVKVRSLRDIDTEANDNLRLNSWLDEEGTIQIAATERLVIDAGPYWAIQAKPAPDRLIGEPEFPSCLTPAARDSFALEVPGQLICGVEAQGIRTAPSRCDCESTPSGGLELGSQIDIRHLDR
ncbi:MAG: hypothetical protein QOJ75_52 [Chloroflexota bacterium]|nr:hypothetical protein [Chloroflexota bacterium]